MVEHRGQLWHLSGDRASAKKDEGIIETLRVAPMSSCLKLLVDVPLKPVVACFCFCLHYLLVQLSRKDEFASADSQSV